MGISNQYQMVGQLKLCGKGGPHEGKSIMMICLNAECEARRLCCLTCIDELHRKHELISLNRFETMLSILKQQTHPDVKAAVLAEIRTFEEEIINGLDDLQMSFAKNIEKSKNKVKEILGQTYQSLNMEFSVNVIEEFYDKFTSSEVCRYLELIRRAEADTFRDLDNTQRVLKLGRAIFEKQGKEADKLQEKEFEDINKSIEKIRLTLNQPYTTKKRVFSKIHKAPSITINEEKDKAYRSQGAGGYPIVIIEEALTECNDNVTVVIKEQPSSKGIWFGVCVLDIVKNFNYSGCYGMNKGSWAIDQVGINHQSAYSWSHHDSNFNSQPKVGWQINTGDIVNVKVDFAKSVVIFTRGANKYEQPIKLDLGDIYAFVGCTHLGDTWGLV